MAKGKELTTVLKFVGVQDKSVVKTITSISKGLGRMNSMVNKAIKATAVAATAIAGTAAAAATATTKALYDMGASWDKASDAIRVGTGATGQQLAELNNSMQTIYKQLPQGKEEIAATIADINTLTGASGAALEAYASNALKASHMLGVDVKTIYTEASKAFNAFNIPAEEMAEKLDHLFKVSQATGVGIDKLAQGAVMGQASFRTLGYSFEQATSLLGQLDKAGVRSETVLAAMKKGAVELAQNGAKDLPKAFAAVADEIKNATTETEAMTIAAKVFGARGGGEIAKALRDGRMSAEAFTKSLVESGESISVAYQDTADFGERIKPVMHTLEVAVKPLADTVFEQINRFIPIVAGVVDKFVPLIAAKATELAKKIETGMTSAINYIQTIDFGAVLDNIAATASKVGETLKAIWDNKDTIIEYTKVALGVAAAIKAIYIAERTFIAISLGIKGVVEAYKIFKTTIIAVKGAFLALKGSQAIIKGLTAAQWAWNAALNANPIGLIVLAIAAVIGIAWVLYDNWDTIVSWCKEQWQAFSEAFPETAQALVTWFELVKVEFMAIWGAIKELGIGVWNAIKIAWNEAVAVFTTIGKLISNAFSTAFDVIGDIVNAIGALLRGDFSEAGEYIQKAFSDAFDGVKRNFEIVGEFFETTINNCKAFFQNFGDTIINMGSAAFGAVKQGLADLGVDWDVVTTKLQALWDKFRVYLEPAMDAVKTLWSAVTAAFSGDWAGACAELQKLWDKFKAFWAPAVQEIQTKWDEVCGELKALWDDPIGWMRKTWVSLTGNIRAGWDKACAWISSKWQGVQSYLAPAIERLRGIWETVTSAVSSLWEVACVKLRPVWDQFYGYISPAIEGIKSVWSGATGLISSAWSEACGALQPAWETFRGYITPAMDAVKSAWDTVSSGVSSAWDATCSGLSTVWEASRSAITGTWDVLAAQWSGITSTMTSLWDGCCNAIKSAWDGIQGGFAAAWEGIKSVAASSIDWLMSKIQPFLSVWDSVKGGVSWVADKIGVGGGSEEAAKTAQTNGEVAKMATGGFTRGLTIAGEAGTEAVISFDPRYRAANQGYLLTAAEMLGMMSPVPAGGATSNHTTNIDLGGITFSPVIHAPTPASASNILDQLRAAVPDLADMLEEELARRAAHRYA